MRLRDQFLLLGAAGVAAAAGLLLISDDSQAASLPVPGNDIGHIAPADGDWGDGDELPANPATGATFRRGPGDPAEASARPRQRSQPAGLTAGIVRGDIQLAVAAIPRLKSITVSVEEARNPFAHDGSFTRAHRIVVPVEVGVGTPTFEVTGVPFSSHPYVIRVHAPGLNGSQRTVVVDEEQPLVDDLVLSISPGIPFSLLVRDQDAQPYAGVQIAMAPLGDPPGRTRHNGTTDNFGSVVFEDVLAGDYQLVASIGGQPVGEPDRVAVPAAQRAYRTAVQGHGHVLLIPRGIPLQVHVTDAGGYGVGAATVTATLADRIRLTTRSAVTDAGGNAEFPHLSAGVWHLTVECENYQRVDLQVTLRPDQPAEPRNVRLIRTKW